MSSLRSESPDEDSSFFFSDGDVVLSAEDEDEATIHFRVHKASLSVFETMFKLPQVTISQLPKDETYLGCPLVVMHDSAEDLRGLLKAIYEPQSVFLPHFDNRTADLLRPALLLSKKYEADELQAKIIAQLKMDWPDNDYLAWYFRYDVIMARRKKSILDCDETFADICPHPENIIHLIHTTGMEEELERTLIMAYYSLVGYCGGQLDSNRLTKRDYGCITDLRIEMADWVTGNIRSFMGTKLGCTVCNTLALSERLIVDIIISSDYLQTIRSTALDIRDAKVQGYCNYQCRTKAAKYLESLAEALYKQLYHFTEVF